MKYKYEAPELEIIEFTEEEISAFTIELSGDMFGSSQYTNTANHSSEC